MTPRQRASFVLRTEIAAIRAVEKSLNDSFDRAVDAILRVARQRGKIVVLGIGKSGIIGAKIAATFSSTGVTAVVLNPVDALHGDLGVVADGDLVLALSYSGESDELLDLLPAIKRFQVTLIGMTGSPKSTLARHCDEVLLAKVPREACPLNLAPTSSTTAMLAFGDALAMAVMEARGFKPRDFAQRHPAGAIGRALFLKVRDIMRRDARNPVAPQTLPVRDALWIMTRAKAGSVSVVDARGRLAGVFTDGDLRRRMSEDSNTLDRTLREVMTRRPVFIRDDALAVDALKIFNQRSIDDLIVVDRSRKPVGLIDSQDLPRLKLM